MAEDRLRRDYDTVENLDELIDAREERDSAFTDDIDGMPDAHLDNIPIDPNKELTFPHTKTLSDEEGAEGINVDLMDTPDENEVEFDWQDSVEEMLPTDPPADEGMGEDGIITAIGHLEPTDISGPASSAEIDADTSTDATDEEKEEYGLDGGDADQCPPEAPVQLDSAMDTDSDEMDFSTEDKFGGELDRETALLEFEEMREEIIEREKKQK